MAPSGNDRITANAHAGPLLGLLKVLGVEASPGGIVVTPRLPEDVGPWKLTTTLLDVEGDERSLKATVERSNQRDML